MTFFWVTTVAGAGGSVIVVVADTKVKSFERFYIIIYVLYDGDDGP